MSNAYLSKVSTDGACLMINGKKATRRKLNKAKIKSISS